MKAILVNEDRSLRWDDVPTAVCGTEESRRPSGLRKTNVLANSLAHRTTWLRSDFGRKTK